VGGGRGKVTHSQRGLYILECRVPPTVRIYKGKCLKGKSLPLSLSNERCPVTNASSKRRCGSSSTHRGGEKKAPDSGKGSRRCNRTSTPPKGPRKKEQKGRARGTSAEKRSGKEVNSSVPLGLVERKDRREKGQRGLKKSVQGGIGWRNLRRGRCFGPKRNTGGGGRDRRTGKNAHVLKKYIDSL